MRISNIAIIAAMAVIAMTGHAFAAVTVSVPEPASMALLAIGVGGVILTKLRRRK
ncbi:MAG: PEP-CTERM sorting domain-containing protein [Acetobacteraceae bacterium]|nr:PEP-CTERM sorting domain-containing protein [Acetobacteraceae bacterium]